VMENLLIPLSAKQPPIIAIPLSLQFKDPRPKSPEKAFTR
jgi:hypothetical protein